MGTVERCRREGAADRWNSADLRIATGVMNLAAFVEANGKVFPDQSATGRSREVLLTDRQWARTTRYLAGDLAKRLRQISPKSITARAWQNPKYSAGSHPEQAKPLRSNDIARWVL